MLRRCQRPTGSKPKWVLGGVHRTRELDQQTVPHRPDDASVVLGGAGIKHLFAESLSCASVPVSSSGITSDCSPTPAAKIAASLL